MFAPLDNTEAWKRLPDAVTGNQAPLPCWARMMASVVPKSTAALLELDLPQRTASPIDPGLRAGMRSVIAAANQCDYAQRASMLDAQVAGVATANLEGLQKQDWSAWTPAEQRDGSMGTEHVFGS